MSTSDQDSPDLTPSEGDQQKSSPEGNFLPGSRARSTSVDGESRESLWDTLPDGRRVMEAGHFVDLISWLLLPDCDTHYPYFCTTSQLVHELLRIFNDPLSLTHPLLVEEYATARSAVAPDVQIKLKVLNVFRIWVIDAWQDFVRSDVTNLLKTLLSNGVHDNDPMVVKSATYVQGSIAQLEAVDYAEGLPLGIGQKATESPERDVPKLPDQAREIPGMLAFFTFKPADLAAQLTMSEMFVFRLIDKSEILFHRWQSAPDQAPNVKTLISQFNIVSAWSLTLILSPDDPAVRTMVVRRLIDLAYELYEIRNFNSLFAIMAGLQSFPVKRLKGIFDKVGRQTMLKFKELEDIVNVQGNFANFRAILARQKMDQPCLPHLGRFLSELIMIEEGNPSEIDGMINYGKFRMIGSLLRQLTKYQAVDYSISADPQIQKYLATLHAWDEEEAFQRSLQLSGKQMDPSQSQKYIFMKKRSGIELPKAGPLVRVTVAFAGLTTSVMPDPKQSSDAVLNELAVNFYFSHYNDGSLRFCEPPSPSSQYTGWVIPLGQPLHRSKTGLVVWRNPVVVEMALYDRGKFAKLPRAVLSYDQPIREFLSHFHRMGNFSSRKVFSLFVQRSSAETENIPIHRSLRDIKFNVESDTLAINMLTAVAAPPKGSFSIKVLYQYRKPGVREFLPRRQGTLFLNENVLWFISKKPPNAQPQILVADYYNPVMIGEGRKPVIQLSLNTDVILGLPDQFLIIPSSLSKATALLDKLGELGSAPNQMEGLLQGALLPQPTQSLWFSLRSHRSVLSWSRNPADLCDGLPFDDSLDLNDCQLLFSEDPTELHCTLKGPRTLHLVFPSSELRQRWLHAFYLHGLPSKPEVHLPPALNPLVTRIPWMPSGLIFGPHPPHRRTGSMGRVGSSGKGIRRTPSGSGSGSSSERRYSGESKDPTKEVAKDTSSKEVKDKWEQKWFTVEFHSPEGTVKRRDLEYDGDAVVNSMRQKICETFGCDPRAWQVVVDGKRLPGHTPFSELTSNFIQLVPRAEPS